MSRGSRISFADKAMYKRQIAVTVGYVAMALIGAFVCRYTEYRAGLANDLAAGIKWVFSFLPLLGLSGFILAIYALSMFTRQPHTLGHIALRLALLAVPLGILVAAFRLVTPMPPAFLSGLSHWASKNVDIEAVQEWLATEGPAFVESHRGQCYVLGKTNDYPECLTAFKPPYINFSPSATEELTVEFRWGGGFQSWGLIVGPPAMKTAQTGRVDRGSESEYQHPVQPGAYVFLRN